MFTNVKKNLKDVNFDQEHQAEFPNFFRTPLSEEVARIFCAMNMSTL